jgi:hypothetical protein
LRSELSPARATQCWKLPSGRKADRSRVSVAVRKRLARLFRTLVEVIDHVQPSSEWRRVSKMPTPAILTDRPHTAGQFGDLAEFG